MKWYFEVLKKYAVFSGRARRSEFWFFTLFNAIALIVLSIIDYAIGTYDVQNSIGILGGIYSLAVLIPSIAVTVRRLHDISRSGWWVLIAFVPIIGGIILLVFTVLDSKPEANVYGVSPKASLAS